MGKVIFSYYQATACFPIEAMNDARPFGELSSRDAAR